MKRYVVKRLGYSVLVIFGVMLICFLLFKFAAGDPSAMLLGKNPSPLEIEQMRDKLSVGQPLVFGRWKRTECYSSADFSDEKDLPSVLIPAAASRKKGELLLPAGTAMVFKRNFDPGSGRVLAKIAFSGRLSCAGVEVAPGVFGRSSVQVPGTGGELSVEAVEESSISSVEFHKANPNPFDSQLASSLRELVTFSMSFPYLSFFNFGRTLTTRERIDRVIWRSMWISLSLMLPIFLAENLVAVPLAMLAAVFRGRLADRLITVVSVSGMSISYIVLIVLGQWILSYRLGIFPVWGFESAYHLALPVLLGTVSGLGGSVRFYRTIFLNELRKEYMRTALSKGCSPLSIYFRHLLGNAAVPIVSRISTMLPFLFTGSLLLESFFGIPGLGYEAVNALNNSDLQMLKALVLLTALLFVAMNLLADIANSYLDPRIRLE